MGCSEKTGRYAPCLAEFSELNGDLPVPGAGDRHTRSRFHSKCPRRFSIPGDSVPAGAIVGVVSSGPRPLCCGLVCAVVVVG